VRKHRSAAGTALALALMTGCGSSSPPVAVAQPSSPAPAAVVYEYAWTKLETVPYKGKQDDIFFTDVDNGYYGNGAGKIYRTGDGGRHWREVLSRPGTYIRTLGFVDARNGFAGNIGTDYFPGVTDTTPLYETHDGGDTWTPTRTISGDPVKGVCAIDVLDVPFINAGKLDRRKVIHAAGRVGGPAVLLTSTDAGHSWVARDMSAQAGMILDVKFTDARTGFLCAGSDAEVERSHALILKTKDGGATWKKVYESTRAYEDVWKCAFPSAEVGYATVQSYDESPRATQRYVAKTVDGGETWRELPLVDDAPTREFGIGFLDEKVGWVGAAPGGFQTVDGGASWTRVEMGKATNKIRFVRGAGGVVGFAIGVDVYRLDVEPAAAR
jgi:photosystem II stability/assembly factor-like uncharacterized protein